MYTTLNKIRAHSPCSGGWTKLLSHLGKTKADDEPLALLTILNSNGLEDTLWCFRAVSGYDKEQRLFAVWCARQVQHLMEDPRSITAIDVAESFALGIATQSKLDVARAAARDAAGDAAGAATWAATWAAARDAAGDATWAAARAATWAAARAAARDAAGAATWAATWAAALDAALDAQEKKLRLVLSNTTTSI